MSNLSPTTSEWIKPLSGNSKAGALMVCLPPAGGGVLGYRPWVEPLRARTDLHAASLPGREYRVREDPARTLDELISPLAQAIAALADRPLLVFGHSFGALLAYEVVDWLCANYLIAPDVVHLVVSGRVAPHITSNAPRLSHLPAREVVFRVAELHRNIPVTLLEEPDYVAMMGRALQADLQITENYTWRERPPLPCPVTALGGLSDPVVSVAEIEAWERHAGGGFECRLFPGGHFYFRTPAGQQSLLEVIAQCCAALAVVSPKGGLAARRL